MPVMHGPGIRNPNEMQERFITDQDVQAYVSIGWKLGALPKGAKVEDVVVPAAAHPVFTAPEVVEEEVFEADSSGEKKSLGKAKKTKAAK